MFTTWDEPPPIAANRRLLYWIATFVSPGGYAPGIRLLAQLCEPILRRVRRVIPPIGQIDFSFLWVSIAIGALLILLR